MLFLPLQFPRDDMSYRIRAPDGLVHDRMEGRWRRTVCEHRHGDRWDQMELFLTEDITTCLQCLAEPDRSGLAPYERR